MDNDKTNVTLDDYIEVQHQFDVSTCVEVIIKTIQYQTVFNVSYPVALEYTRQEYRFNEINKK